MDRRENKKVFHRRIGIILVNVVYICSMEEIWMPVVGYEDIYIVSSLGAVKRIKTQTNNQYGAGFVLKNNMNRGYCSVQLHNGKSAKSMRVHRLVASAFIPNPENKPHINHINGIKHDNRIENLEWCTPSENEKHSYDVLGKISSKCVLSSADVVSISNRYSNGEKMPVIAKDYGVTVTAIHMAVTGKSHKKVPIIHLKKRHKGSGNGSTHLIEQDILDIRSRFIGEHGLMYKTVAAEYGVSYQTISRIVNRENWTHI